MSEALLTISLRLHDVFDTHFLNDVVILGHTGVDLLPTIVIASEQQHECD